MSLLPQRKKSAEEIAKLREALGIPGGEPEAGELPVSPAPPPSLPAAAARIPDPLPPPPAPAPVFVPEIPVALPPAVEPLAAVVAEKVPVLNVEVNGPPPPVEIPTQVPAAPVPAPAPAAVSHGPKRVRSLRKSEQGPLQPVHAPPPGSPLPVHRHSAAEIKAIRRQEALAPHAHIPHPSTLTAHPVLHVPGYLLALGGAACCLFYDLPVFVPAICEGLALLLAVFIFIRKPLSRHHAGFIAVIALLVVVFGALHYFPNLKYGT